MSAMRIARTAVGVWLIGLACCGCQNPGDPNAVQLPAVFAANRIFVEPILVTGDTIRFLTDTGGIGFLSESVSDNLSLVRRDVLQLPDSVALEVVNLPGFVASASIPSVPTREDAFTRALDGGMRVLADDPWGELKDEMVGDGMLGHEWFSGRVWRIDYVHERFELLTSAPQESTANDHSVKLGFPVDSAGRRTWHWPSIDAEIDGEVLPFLLDTGATVVCDSAALAVLDDSGPKIRAASFLAGSHFDRLAISHPEWRIIEGAEQGGFGAMLEVPSITIAGHTVGPVWFTRRPDPSFHSYMSRRMDRRIEGALGGSVLKYFRVTIDYPGAVATFERFRGNAGSI